MEAVGIHGNRHAILACGVVTMLMCGTVYAWSLFIPPLEAEFGWTRSQTSTVFSIAMIGLSLGMLSIGQLSKKVSLRVCFAVSTSLIVFGLLSCPFIVDLWQLYVFYGVCCGVGSGMSYAVWTTNTLAWFGDRVGFASGVLVMGFGMGALVLGSLASALMYSPLGWRFAFAAIAVLVLAEALVAFGFIRDPSPAVQGLRPRRDIPGASLSGSQAMREPSFWLFCLWRSMVMGAVGAVIAEASVMMTDIGATVALATAAVGSLGLGNGLGRPLGGLLYDHIGRDRTLVALSAAALAVSVGMAVAYRLADPMLFVPFLLVEGLLYGMYAAINASYMRTTFGQAHLAMNVGISAVVLAPFNLVFPLAAAMLFEWTGSYGSFFVLVPAFALLSLVCGILCKPANRRLSERYEDGEGRAVGRPCRPPFSLREMAEDDLDAVMDIEISSFQDPWTPLAFALDLRHNAHAHYAVAVEIDGPVVGYLGWWDTPGGAVVVRVATAAAARRRGVGRALVAWAGSEAAAIGQEHLMLEVRASSDGPRMFYERLGFEWVDVRKDYYDHPRDDAAVMALSLVSSPALSRGDGGVASRTAVACGVRQGPTVCRR